MNFCPNKPYDLNEIKSLLELQRELIRMDFEKLITESSQKPEIVPREKLIQILGCSSSWLSKVTTRGDIPSITISGRVFYDLREISKIKVKKKLFSVRKYR